MNKDKIPENPKVGDLCLFYRRRRYWYKPSTWFESNYSRMRISNLNGPYGRVLYNPEYRKCFSKVEVDGIPSGIGEKK